MKTEQDLRDILGQNVKKRRERKNISQEKLAEKIRVTKNTISDIETGQKFARATTLIKLANALETDVYELLKPDNVLPDKASDILAKYSEEVKNSLEKIGNKYIDKMK